MEEVNPFIGFLARRGFKLGYDCYNKAYFDYEYKLRSDANSHFIICIYHVSGQLAVQKGQAIHDKRQVFSDEEVEKELLRKGMRFFPQTDLNQ
jgi:hypothetical protein